MPYVKSQSRQMFEAKASEYARAIQASRGLSASLREYICCAALIRCSAQIEAYLRTIICDWFTKLNATPIDTDKLPQSIRVRHLVTEGLLGAHRKLIAYQDEAEWMATMGRLLGKEQFTFAVDGVISPRLHASRITDGKLYPSEENIATLFRRIGIMRIFDELNKSAKANMRDILTSFNDARNSWAHEGLPPGLNAADVRDKIRGAIRFVKHLDRVLYRHVSRIGGVGTW